MMRSTIIVLSVSLFVVSCSSLMYGKKLTKNVNKLRLGMTQDQVAEILDSPDFSEASGNTQNWNYNLLIMDKFIEQTAPYTLVFTDGKLTFYGVNQGAVDRNVAIEAARQSAPQINVTPSTTPTTCRSTRDVTGAVTTQCQ